METKLKYVVIGGPTQTAELGRFATRKEAQAYADSLGRYTEGPNRNYPKADAMLVTSAIQMGYIRKGAR